MIYMDIDRILIQLCRITFSAEHYQRLCVSETWVKMSTLHFFFNCYGPFSGFAIFVTLYWKLQFQIPAHNLSQVHFMLYFASKLVACKHLKEE